MTQISLAPNGYLRLTFEAHHVDIAPTAAGMSVLVRILTALCGDGWEIEQS